MADEVDGLSGLMLRCELLLRTSPWSVDTVYDLRVEAEAVTCPCFGSFPEAIQTSVPSGMGGKGRAR